MSYQLYRNTTIGNTLQESLDELIQVMFTLIILIITCDIYSYVCCFMFDNLQYGQITPALAVKVLLQFDKSINQALSNRVKSRLTFKAGKLNTYRFVPSILLRRLHFAYLFIVKFELISTSVSGFVITYGHSC